ncbi:MAG TPA: hypothetical protein VGL97_10725 [Bryobacteraceae bacterium]|jgi:hypothetical protein
MALLTKRILGMTLLAASLGMGAMKADDTRRATFNLPVKAYWGDVLLSPGQYTMWIPVATHWPQVVALSAHGKTVFVLAGIESAEPQSKGSYLELSKVNGSYVIDEFSSGISGKLFKVQKPKVVRN